MPLDPQNTAQIRDRELRVWDLLLKGIEGLDIARREGVHPSVISRIKTRVERRITAETDGKAASLKKRVAGKFGHLDNLTAASLLSKIDCSKLKHVIAAHLSRQNNSPELARGALAAALACATDWIGIAEQDAGFAWREA